MHKKAKHYIETLQLERHPEGGYYKEVYRSGELILPEHLPKRYKSSRVFCTSIYFLLEGKQVSKFHRLESDELWHFYDGTTLLVYKLNEKGELKMERVGRDNKEITDFKVVIEKNNWFAAELEDKSSFALIGCTVAPGFEFEDFELGDREKLIGLFPKHKNILERLTD